MAKLFLDGIFKWGSESPSSVKISMPYKSSKTTLKKLELVGLTTGDPSFSAQNKWGTIINDISNLQDVASLIGSSSMFSWINASTMCWKGTSPLMMGIEFYLINYKKGLDLEEQLKILIKLAALESDHEAKVGSSFKVLTHGGYAADILEGNDKIKGFFSSSVTSSADLGSVDLTGLYDGEGNAISSLTVQFGHKSKISNLLLSKIDVTESNIEVADQNGDNPRPLYYRVNAQFTGVRPLLTVDVDNMFSFAKG